MTRGHPWCLTRSFGSTGGGAQGHETFHFQATGDAAAGGGRTFQFCKTNRKPYDQLVMQVLLVLKHYLGEAIRVTSDGDFAVEWAAARQELARRYGIHTGSSQPDEALAA